MILPDSKSLDGALFVLHFYLKWTPSKLKENRKA